jgi:hypothetical protein
MLKAKMRLQSLSGITAYQNGAWVIRELLEQLWQEMVDSREEATG